MNMVTFKEFDTQHEAVAAGRVWIAAGVATSLVPVTTHIVMIDQDAIQHLDLHEIRKIKARASAAARRAAR